MISFRQIIFCVLFFALPIGIAAQTETPAKKNGRPDTKNIAPAKTVGTDYKPAYFYTFDRPGFRVPKIILDHDETGRGQITFTKDDSTNVPITDPVQLSETTLTNIKTAFAALNFIDSNEDYQYAAHDFSNMGNITLALKRDGRMRTVKYNWTENKNAKFLMDEYRRISDEYIWKFEMKLARENQPLQTPELMESFESYFRRGKISDPPHLVPFLTELSTDERLPLMARDRAVKLIKQINKASK
jgi:hypothetical protein